MASSSSSGEDSQARAAELEAKRNKEVCIHVSCSSLSLSLSSSILLETMRFIGMLYLIHSHNYLSVLIYLSIYGSGYSTGLSGCQAER